MKADRYYEPAAAAFLAGRALQDAGRTAVDGLPPSPETRPLPLHYFKRVELLPRIQWALGVLHSLGPANLLDIGSGRGKFLWPLLDAFPDLPVTALDADPRRIRDLQAVRLGGIDRLAVRLADAAALPFADQEFDVVTVLEVLEHLPSPAQAIAEARRVARRCLLISAPSKPDDNPEHIHLFAEADLRALLAAAGVTGVKVQQTPGHWLVLAKLGR